MIKEYSKGICNLQKISSLMKIETKNIITPSEMYARSLSFLRSVYCNLLYRFIETCCFKHFLYLVFGCDDVAKTMMRMGRIDTNKDNTKKIITL